MFFSPLRNWLSGVGDFHLSVPFFFPLGVLSGFSKNTPQSFPRNGAPPQSPFDPSTLIAFGLPFPVMTRFLRRTLSPLQKSLAF